MKRASQLCWWVGGTKCHGVNNCKRPRQLPRTETLFWLKSAFPILWLRAHLAAAFSQGRNWPYLEDARFWRWSGSASRFKTGFSYSTPLRNRAKKSVIKIREKLLPDWAESVKCLGNVRFRPRSRPNFGFGFGFGARKRPRFQFRPKLKNPVSVNL